MDTATLGSNQDPISLLTKFEIYGVKLARLGKPRSERSIPHQFLNSLPNEYARKVSHLKGNETLTKVEVERRIGQFYDVVLTSARSKSSNALSANHCVARSNSQAPKRNGRRYPQHHAKGLRLGI